MMELHHCWLSSTLLFIFQIKIYNCKIDSSHDKWNFWKPVAKFNIDPKNEYFFWMNILDLNKTVFWMNILDFFKNEYLCWMDILDLKKNEYLFWILVSVLNEYWIESLLVPIQWKMFLENFPLFAGLFDPFSRLWLKV